MAVAVLRSACPSFRTARNNMAPQTDTILSLEMPYRDDLVLQRTVFGGDALRRVAVVSGVHGDEIEGLFVCHELARWLEANPQSLKGRVELYPVANPLGVMTMNRAVPVFETDLNRNFPGHPQGLLPQRMAHTLMTHCSESSLVIDIHASNIFLRELPQVRINEDFVDTLVPLAMDMNLDVIWVHGATTVLEATLSHSLNNWGTPCLVVELGVGMRITPAFIDQIVAGILRVWQRLGVIDPEAELPACTHKPMIADDHNVHYLNAATSGLFVPMVPKLNGVTKGQLLWKIGSAFQGKRLSTVVSPVDGFLFTLREHPIVFEGSLMARIMEKPVQVEVRP